jgi:translation initiation factor 4G
MESEEGKKLRLQQEADKEKIKKEEELYEREKKERKERQAREAEEKRISDEAKAKEEAVSSSSFASSFQVFGLISGGRGKAKSRRGIFRQRGCREKGRR